MSKKSLRTAIDLHQRLTDGRFRDGSYGNLTGSDRKSVFNSKLLELEPILKPCPFCDEKPVFDRGCLSSHGMCSGGGGWSANITCNSCDYVFKGPYGVDICHSWNNRHSNTEGNS